MSPERGGRLRRRHHVVSWSASLFVRYEGAMSGNDFSQALSLGVVKTLWVRANSLWLRR